LSKHNMTLFYCFIYCFFYCFIYCFFCQKSISHPEINLKIQNFVLRTALHFSMGYFFEILE